MKLNIGKKILMLLHWLCSLMICVALTLCLIVPGLQERMVTRAEASMGIWGARILGIVLLALYLALSVAQLLTIVKRKTRSERGFISVGSDDKGRVRIAVSAVEQMVRQSVQTIDGIVDMKVDIEGLDDAIGITINATIANGCHVPTITANMKRSITQFVEVNCGVSVQAVAITINAVSSAGSASKRRLLGRNRGQNSVSAGTTSTVPADVEPIEAEPEAAIASIGDDVAVEDTAEEAVVSEAVTEETETPDAETATYGFDPDKPYESEFAKDLAAMRAREAAEAADSSPQE